MLLTSLISKRHYKNLEWFYTHSIIRQFALSMFGIFNSIYVFQTLIAHNFDKHQSLALTAMFFSLVYFSHFFAIQLSIMTINKWGLKKCMLIGGILTTLFSLTLYLGRYNLLFLILSAILAGSYLGFYYIAFHIYFTELTDDKNEGEEVALGSILPSIVCILGPICAGLIIKLAGFNGVFLTTGIFLILANFPLKFIPNTKDGIKIHNITLLSFLKFKTGVKNRLALAGHAISEATNNSIWPLFIFPLLSGGFIELGFVGSVVATASTVTVFLVGFIADKLGSRMIVKVLSVADSLVWLGKIFVYNPLGVFIFSATQALTTLGQGIGLDSMIYSKSRNENDITIIVEREFSYAIAKCGFLFLMGVLFWLGLPLVTAFALAALAALLTRIYKL